MAVMKLADLYEAVTLTAGPPAAETKRWEALHAAIVAAIERYAPEAPEPIQNEAAIRFAGYAADVGGVTSETVGELTIQSTDRFQSPAVFVRSGAKGLLSPWKRRRAGRIG